MSYKVNVSCLQFSLLTAWLLFWLPGSGQPSFGETDQLLKSNQKVLGNNLVALVWKDGKMVYQKELQKEIGDFSAKAQAPIGDCGQWMVAALVMTFVDEGKLSLDDKVSKFLPLYAKYMKTYITIRNCLSFTTGIQADPSGAMKIIQKSKYPSLEDEVNSFASKREIENNPGMEVYYSHVGFNIAGRVLEIIGKKPFDRLMQERIIRPLKMHGTTFSDENGGAINPSGGGQSTANDYMNFLIMILNNGVFQGKRVLSEKAIKEMETPQFTELPVKFMPKPAAGWHVALGDWVMMSGNSVIGTINSSGTWAFIDRCRSYAAIIMVRNPQSEPQDNIYRHFKESIDRQIPPSCQ